ncbi:MAG: hypothetical protein WBQ26_06925 [Gemmatimonadaceae bacterium]
MRPLAALTAFMLSAPCALPAQSAPTDGEQLIVAMHDRYAATWYRTLTFVQRSIWYNPDGSEDHVQTWREALAAPGRLRIDIGDGPKRNGAIFRADSTYSFAADTLAGASAERNLLLVLGFDVYAQAPERTATVLRAEDIDLSKIHRANFKGRPVWVVGAAAGDTMAKQFWVDAERLLFVRLIQRTRTNTAWQDIRFNRYTPVPGGWLADQVQVWLGGKLTYEEDYSDVRVNVTLDPALWNPAAWATVPLWWR